MTVDEGFFQATESLVLPSPRIYYPVRIPVRHWQLRCLISAPSSDTLYYASDSDIWRLNTRSRKQDLLTTLPFEPRCLAAGHGWLCAGGVDNGQFASIRIGASSGADVDRAQSSRARADVDSVLPLDLDPELRRQTQRFLSTAEVGVGSGNRPGPHVRTHELGQMIVNSVTLHQSSYDSFGDNEGILAILTNNDKTVRIFSLSQDRLLASLDFAFAMNHATVSPRGDVLVAVGDDPIVYFCRRGSTGGPSQRWQCCSEHPLPSVSDLHVVNDGCSTTAFSPSGHLCAVASQAGMITIFDTRYVGQADQDAIVKVLPSSRPRTEAGVIRSMCFSPEPWDLLICAEQSGRVCVMDVRNEFGSRQVVRLNMSLDTVETAEVSDDFNVEDLIDPRLREGSDSEFIRQYRQTIAAQDEVAAANFAADYVEASSERRRLQRLAREDSPQPFTDRERQILEALRTSRERIEGREQQGATSINYAHPTPVVTHHNRDSSSSPAPQIDRRHLPLSWTQSTTSVPSLRDYIRDRNSNRDRDRDRARAMEARRRASVVLSQEDLGSASTSRELPEAPFTASPPRLPVQSDGPDPWQTIEAAMASGPLPDAATRLRREREAGVEASFQRRQEIYMRLEQRRRERLRNLYSEVEGMGRYGGNMSHVDREAGPGTAGCAMSEDGRKLYIGMEEGIMELHVNIQGRKCFPQDTPR